jgi:hypothetical protein
MLTDVIVDTFTKVCGKHQTQKPEAERKAFKLNLSLSLNYDKEDGYRHHLEVVIYGPMNYVQVYVRETWDVIPVEDLEDEDDGGPKPGKKYQKGSSPWQKVSDHDSGWRDGVQRVLSEHQKKITGFSGPGWYELTDPAPLLAEVEKS